MKKFIDLIVRHEGLRLKPYRCTSGKLTIGVGRNLEDTGISEEEAGMMLQNDVLRFVDSLQKFDWFNECSEIRQMVLVDMAFMGIGSLLGFKEMIKALEAKDYEKAAEEMLDSKWARQVGKRSAELAKMMLEDSYELD